MRHASRRPTRSTSLHWCGISDITLLPAVFRYRRVSSTYTSAKPFRPTSRPQTDHKAPRLSLEHFIVRQRVIALYRTVIRALQALPKGSVQRTDLKAYARGEFERHRNVTDTGKIRYLVSTGKTEFDGMKRYLQEMGGR